MNLTTVVFVAVLLIAGCSGSKNGHQSNTSGIAGKTVVNTSTTESGGHATAAVSSDDTIAAEPSPIDKSMDGKWWVSSDSLHLFIFGMYWKRVKHNFEPVGTYADGLVSDTVSHDTIGIYSIDGDSEHVSITLAGKTYRCFRAYPGPSIDYNKYDPECSTDLLRAVGFTFNFTQGTCDYLPPDSMKLEKLATETGVWSADDHESLVGTLTAFYEKSKSCWEDPAEKRDNENCGMYCVDYCCWGEGGDLLAFKPVYVAPVLDTLKSNPDKYFAQTRYRIPGTNDTLSARTIKVPFTVDSLHQEMFYDMTEIGYRDTTDRFGSLYDPVYSPSSKAMFLVTTFPGAEAKWWNIYRLRNGKIDRIGQIGYGL